MLSFPFQLFSDFSRSPWQSLGARRISRTALSLAVLLAGYLPSSATRLAAQEPAPQPTAGETEPVDYVNPYMGNISHMLRATDPTVSLPNGMLRMTPDRTSFTAEQVGGLMLIVTAHRNGSAFRLRPFEIAEGGDAVKPPERYTYDQEKTAPYRYSVYLDEQATDIAFAPARKSALYRFAYEHSGAHAFALSVKQGALKIDGQTVSGYESIGSGGGTKIYLYLAFSAAPEKTGVLRNGEVKFGDASPSAEGANAGVAVSFGAATAKVGVRYGVSYLSVEQARKNVDAEIPAFDLEPVAQAGRQAWNTALGKIRVAGGTDDDKAVFYTSLYRIYERMINVSEDGKYYSPFDGQVHEDGGTPFYTDDWIWDTYRAVHPLRILINPDEESQMVASYVRMAQQSREGWMPTFPQVFGDLHAMNGKHFVSMVWDAYDKGLRGFDLEAAYMACKKSQMESTLCPWIRAPATNLDAIYKEKGYFPALKIDEVETEPVVKPSEKRQAVAVTLAASYDSWCLAQIARALGKTEDYQYFQRCSYNYRHLFNPETGFFHPRDADGHFIEPFDYRYSGGKGGRDYYDENNGWTYRWEVAHNVADLMQLMGGREKFVRNLDRLFVEDIGRGRNEFYAQFPDSTGNIGQFTMANEPSMHIPYLYNYAGAPWKTQRRVREVLRMWFRNDLMGVPGDEDGGGLSSFVVFSSMGFYPVTPGTGSYNIGSPVFSRVTMDLGRGRTFVVEASGASEENKYVQSARLNGREWNKPWFSQSDLSAGGKLELRMGNRPNKEWGAAPDAAPPSAGAPPAGLLAP